MDHSEKVSLDEVAFLCNFGSFEPSVLRAPCLCMLLVILTAEI